MGTLYNQPVRNRYNDYNINDFLDEVNEIAKSYKIEKQDVINAFKTLELRRKNDLYVSNADVHDEQMVGMGHEIQSVTNALQEIALNLKTN